ncbi:MAG: DNA-deoxyinosine glycosylase [Sulfurovaceae bacterium]|jgi:double-stranded uracil-DNA glycosylase|nr:DNA-deoxyinosine glycosylase [Sulfurovaceae bacterium]MDD5548894.1 DNA-deoxyinosine glycosylase [Sulfurovaceae bacterium]
MVEILSHPFKPIVFKDSKILILGSFPSIKSFENDFYYANPQNQFWKIMSALTKYPINNKDQKIWLLKEKKIALWDMIKSCNRENSLDSSIENEDVNDIVNFLESYPDIKKIAFTGKKSQALFEYHFGHIDIQKCYLPSPSSAYAKMTLEQKIEKYRELLKI